MAKRSVTTDFSIKKEREELKMPNWCYTNITIDCDDEVRLKEFEEKLNGWMNHNYKDNGFGLTWLGNLVGNSGIRTVDECKDTDLCCRGSIIYTENFGTQLLIDTETAWTPMLQLFEKLLEKYLPEAELIYSAEEPGGGILHTNDPDLSEKYYVDVMDLEVDLETRYDYSDMELAQALEELFKTKFNNLNEALDAFNKSSLAEDIRILKWKYASTDEWD